jgi:D-alanyl-D-alanine carboxypeptidase
MDAKDYESRVSLALAALGIPMELITRKRLPLHVEAQNLVIADVDKDDREYLLIPEAAIAWEDLQYAAKRDGVILELVSAFRSIERQSEIIRAKIERGMPMETILSLSAPPGYSEHHTGCAVDLNTPGCAATEAQFEDTEAFRWLALYASRFGFTLSYPQGNRSGFIYEPWHWFFQPVELWAGR